MLYQQIKKEGSIFYGKIRNKAKGLSDSR